MPARVGGVAKATVAAPVAAPDVAAYVTEAGVELVTVKVATPEASVRADCVPAPLADSETATPGTLLAAASSTDTEIDTGVLTS
jgi:hypothetical protein